MRTQPLLMLLMLLVLLVLVLVPMPPPKEGTLPPFCMYMKAAAPPPTMNRGTSTPAATAHK